MDTRPVATLASDLAGIALFHRTDASLILAALGACEVLQLPAGTVLLKAGEINHNVYLPLSGSVVVHLDAKISVEATISIAVGECVGELSAIDGKPTSGLVLAQTAARVLKIPQDIFWNHLMILPGVAASFMGLLSERVRRTTSQALKAQAEQIELKHLRKELTLARQLQSSMLPAQGPLFAGRQDVEVCGFMEPASNVGGDLFDAFFVREHLLFICIGDVSGHGIASALFMARAVGLLRILATNCNEPDVLLKELNERLCVNNDTNLFLTLFCGFLDIETWQLDYSNGGHCPPILLSGGQVEDLPIPKGPLIGAFPGARFLRMTRALGINDVLCCYTDGVTEAQNTEDEEFSEVRCRHLLGQATDLPLQAVIDGVRRQVAEFTGTEVLDDDFTMLALKRTA
jgi:sigma-B regulation protein RsbU (phosphoserine phosphatase)